MIKLHFMLFLLISLLSFFEAQAQSPKPTATPKKGVSKKVSSKRTSAPSKKSVAKRVAPQKVSVTPAQPQRNTIVNKPSPRVIKPALKPVTLATPAPAPAGPPPSKWRLSYFGEYYGPRLGNIDLGRQASGPTDNNTSWAEWDHYLKVGYAVLPGVIFGTQIRAISPNDPTQTFSFKDSRLYLTWGNMASTQDLDIAGTFVTEFPTTDRSRAKGKIVAFQVKNNWTLKTALRNWSFSATTLLNPVFYSNPYGASGSGTTDFNIAIYPWITMDISPNVQFLMEGSFDANHNYASTTYEFQQGDPDYWAFGAMFTVNQYISFYPELRFWADDISFKTAELYLGFNAAL